MDYSSIFQALQEATLFDLYRLRRGIDTLLQHPGRLEAIRQRLRPGQRIAYFDGPENRLVEAVVEAVQRNTVVVRNVADGKGWRIQPYMINLEGVACDIHPQPGQTRLERSHLQVGETVGFRDKNQREHYGRIQQLNPKTATLLTREGLRWRVGYELLFKVMESQGRAEPECGLLEGTLTEETIPEETIPE
ncbi:MAG: hypothetical protein HQL56_13185 [Magnetococcales bacterium]|nr:hypothetical protein [Magnetococcales bacterium]